MTTGSLFLGERVRLTSLYATDAQTMTRWYEDGEFSRLFDANPSYPRSENSIHKWLDGLERDRDSYALAIRLTYSDDLIGYAQIDGIQWTHGCGWLAVGIGSPDYRGKGYGTEAMRLILRFAFGELNLHRLQLTVFSYNERAIRLYERMGFQREGVFRECLLRDGQRHNMLLYGLLTREWRAAQSSE